METGNLRKEQNKKEEWESTPPPKHEWHEKGGKGGGKGKKEGARPPQAKWGNMGRRHYPAEHP